MIRIYSVYKCDELWSGPVSTEFYEQIDPQAFNTRPIVVVYLDLLGGGNARHCVDQISGLIVSLYSQGSGTARPGGLHVRACHAFQVLVKVQTSI